MDGSVSASQSERAHSQLARGFAHRAANEAHTQSELFEQLLSLNFTVQPPPEKPATPTESLSTDDEDSQCECSDKNPAADDAEHGVEETHDEEASHNVLTAVMPGVTSAQQPMAPMKPESKGADDAQLGKLAPETKLCDLPKAIEEASSPTVIDATNEGDAVVQAEVSAATVEAPAVKLTENSTKPTEAAALDEGDAVGRRGKEKNSNDSTAVAAAVDEPIVEPTVNAQEDSKPEKSPAAPSDLGQLAAIDEMKKQAGDEQQGERREKWFERDASLVAASGDSAKDQSAAQTDTERSEPAPIEAANDLHLQASVTADPFQAPADLNGAVPVTAPTTPAVVPVGLVTATQAASAASSSGSVTTGSETNPLGPAAPTRTVGTQAAKADSKSKTESSEISQQERVRVIQRIARSFNRISAEGGTINLRLHPEHLGSVTVQVKLEGRTMAARLTTETAAARDAIMADLPALRQRLADQGFDVTKFQVDVAGNGADATFAQTQGESQSRQYENRSSGSQTDYRRLAANRETRLAFARQAPLTTTATTLTGAGLDLQV